MTDNQTIYHKTKSFPDGSLQITLTIGGINRMIYKAYPVKPHFSTYRLYPQKLLNPLANIPRKHEISIFDIKN